MIKEDVEVWLPVPGFPDYQISSYGRVIRRTPDRYGRISGKPLNLVMGNHGYLVASFHCDARQSVKTIHRLVCLAFRGNPLRRSYYAAHADGNKTNNYAINLRWASSSENNMDKHLHGTMKMGRDHHSHAKPDCMPRGTSHGNAKLTEDIVTRIRSDKRSQKTIAAEYSVTQSLISMVKTGKIWTHV